jgi:hypothetical protein
MTQHQALLANEIAYCVHLPKTQNYHSSFPLTTGQFLSECFCESFCRKRYDVCPANANDCGCFLNTRVMPVCENVDPGSGSESKFSYRVSRWETARDLVISGTR